MLFGLWLLLGGFFTTGLYTLVDGLEPPDVEMVDLQFPLAGGDHTTASSPVATTD